LITSGHIDIDIYKRRIKVVVKADYINPLGRKAWMLNYYYLEYRHRFFRWLFERSAIERIQQLSAEIGLPIHEIRNYRIIDGDSPHENSIIKKSIIFDISKTKEE
jgi:hypothetical protein